MTATREPKKAALVLTDDDRAVLSSLPDGERAMVEDMMRRRAGLTAAEAAGAARLGTGGRTASFARNWDLRAGRRNPRH